MTEPNQRASRFQRRCLRIALIPMALAAAQLAASSLAIPTDVITFLAMLVLGAIGILEFPAAVYCAWRFGPERRGPLVALLLLFALSLVSFASMIYLNWPLRKFALARAADRAELVIDAIKRFEQAQGRPPRSLEEPVPVHLSTLPGTGLVAHPEFHYHQYGDWGGSLVWWDLGSRRGASMVGLSVYPDGDPDHAIVVFELDDRGGVSKARVDRMPATTERRAFSSESWRANPEQRLQMVDDLKKRHDWRSKDRPELEQLLGPPSGSRVLRDALWELSISCLGGILNCDHFFYWPSERYPKKIYAGVTETIGRWAYAHE